VPVITTRRQRTTVLHEHHQRVHRSRAHSSAHDPRFDESRPGAMRDRSTGSSSRLHRTMATTGALAQASPNVPLQFDRPSRSLRACALYFPQFHLSAMRARLAADVSRNPEAAPALGTLP
jgi:hypothetical protein